MLHLLSQGPASFAVPVQGSFPSKSIERCRVSVLQVPEHVPQLSHAVHSPSTALKKSNYQNSQNTLYEHYVVGK